jgi:hypothetical protein
MVHSNCNNGPWQRQRQWAMGNCNGDGNGNGDVDGDGDGDGDSNGNEVRDGDGNNNGKGEGQGKGDHEGRVASSYGGDVQRFWTGNTSLPPPPWTYRKVHSPALHHGGDTAKSVCSPSRGRVPDSSPWIVFCLFFTTNVQFTEQPSVCPPHYSGTQEPCQVIDPLPPPLLQEPHQPIDNLPRLLLHFLSRQVWAGLAMIITLLFCVDVK